MAYDNTNSGALFKNDRKQNDKHPDYNGSLNVDGTDYWLSGWLKEKNGKKFFSLSVKPKDANYKPKSKPAQNEAIDEDVPF